MNKGWSAYATRQRLLAALEGVPAPNRRQIRDFLRHNDALRGLRRVTFGAWRHR